MSETIDLRPCAFCGRNAQKILRSKIPDYHFFVKCGHCKAQTGEHASKMCAIYAWNYRDYLPYTPRHTDAAPGEAEGSSDELLSTLGRELIAWAAQLEHAVRWADAYYEYCRFCGAHRDVKQESELRHAPDCLHLRARALREESE